MPFESQNFKMKAFYVPLKPIGFFPISHCFMVQGCFLSLEDKRWVSLVKSSLIMLDFCSSNPGNLKWWHLAYREMYFPDCFLNPVLPFLQCGFPVFKIQIWCAANAFPVSTLSDVCKEGRKEKIL